MPKFTISILALNNLELTKRCIASVLAHSSDYELLLTDNGSTDGVGAYFDELAKEFPQISVVHNATNLGYQEPNRIALEKAVGVYLVLLNNDCVVPPDWLTELEKPFSQFATASITGPRECSCALQANFKGFRSPKFEYIQFSTACLKVEVFRKHGLWLDGIRHSYADDSSTCLRMRELGYTLHLVPINVIHYGGQTSKFVPDIRNIQEANEAFCRRHFAHYLTHRKMDYPILIRRTGAFGDVLLTTPIIRALRKDKPLSPIYVETGCPEMLRGNPNVAKVDRKIRRTPDMQIINLDGAYEAAIQRHYVASYAERAGVTLKDYRTDLFLSEADKVKAEGLLPSGDFIAIHPGPCAWKSRDWPADRFAALATILRAEGHKIVLVGLPGRTVPYDVDTRAKLTIHETAAVIQRCKLFIGIDSLPFHLAEAVGTPVFGIFGITDPQYVSTRPDGTVCVCGTAPSFGLRHRVAGQSLVDDGGAAMASISTEDALGELREFLGILQGVAP